MITPTAPPKTIPIAFEKVILVGSVSPHGGHTFAVFDT